MNIIAYTDGSCLGNGTPDAPGGYGVVILMYTESGIIRKELSGEIENTTNNRAELTAVIQTLKEAKTSCNFEFHLDSKYVIGCATGDNIKANKDLWSEYVHERKRHDSIKFMYVPGHKGHPDNERANQLAQLEASKLSMMKAIKSGKTIPLFGKNDDVNHITGQINGKEINHVDTKHC